MFFALWITIKGAVTTFIYQSTPPSSHPESYLGDLSLFLDVSEEKPFFTRAQPLCEFAYILPLAYHPVWLHRMLTCFAAEALPISDP